RMGPRRWIEASGFMRSLAADRVPSPLRDLSRKRGGSTFREQAEERGEGRRRGRVEIQRRTKRRAVCREKSRDRARDSWRSPCTLPGHAKESYFLQTSSS